MYIGKSNFRFKWLILGTLINLSQIPLFFIESEFSIVGFFFAGVLLNQYMLYIVVADLTGIKKNTTILPTWLCASTKLLTLMLAFGVAISQTEQKELILLEMYIFQLIILVISTKRIVKKN